MDDNTASLTWPDFLRLLEKEREHDNRYRSLRPLATDIAVCATGLLFPQLSRRVGVNNVEAEAAHLSLLLTQALEAVQENAARHVVSRVLDSLPAVRAMLILDANSILSGDPAAESLDEVILAYPGFLATVVHRVAHEIHRLNVPILPRMLSEWAHAETGIDIHPGAQIGSAFAIDHGTGVVIGETTIIGDRVRIYQGVTLGALAVRKQLANKKRHPTIGDDVIIYANATILGGTTSVGSGSIIGGNVWLTNSVPPRSIVQFSSRVEQRSTDENDDGLEFHI